ncbi:MAG: glycerol-3-phosphate dehydrogenase C-terminal domain-containing protein, partial [Gemmatimonadales bacterium]
EREMPMTLADVMVRRLHLFHEAPRHGLDGVGPVVDIMAAELGWHPEDCDRQAQAYLAEIERSEEFRAGITDAQ